MLDHYLSKRFGFTKVDESQHGVIYQRWNQKYHYMQIVHIAKKDSGCHIIQSYDKDLFDEKMIGNTCVGLAVKEMLPLWLKAKVMAHKYHWNRRRKKNG